MRPFQQDTFPTVELHYCYLKLKEISNLPCPYVSVIVDEPHAGYRNIIYKHSEVFQGQRTHYGPRESYGPSLWKITYAQRFADDFEVENFLLLSFPFLPKYMLCFKSVIKGKPASICTNLNESAEVCSCSSMLRSIWYFLISVHSPSKGWASPRSPRSLAIGAWQGWWKPLLWLTEPSHLPSNASLLATQTLWLPWLVSLAKPRAGCQSCASQTPSVVSSWHCSLSARRLLKQTNKKNSKTMLK